MFSSQNNLNSRMTVLITGASGGLGRAFTVECASRGWDLFITDTQLEPLSTLANSLTSTYGVRILTRVCDLTDPAAREDLFRYLRSNGCQFTMLINVAGVDFEGPFLDQDIRSIETILRLNIEASVAMVHSILRFRTPESTFRVINVASLAAFYPMPVKATYAASKRFLVDFSLALREELAPEDVTVTVLCPAGMPTTPSTIQAINAQGLAGFLTTMDAGRVADQTLNAAIAGKAVVIPGMINFMLKAIGSLLPPTIIAKLIHHRWMSVKSNHVSRKITPEKSYLPFPSR